MKYLSAGILLLVLFAMNAATVYAEPVEVGIFLKQEKNCTIQDPDGSISCRKDLGIRNGDIINTSLDHKKLKIRWISREVSLEQISVNTYRVVYTRPKTKSGIVASVKDVLGFNRTSSARISSMAATRGKKPVQPAAAATLVSGLPTVFAWSGCKATRFVIRNAAGETVFEQPVDKLKELTLLPEKIGLQHGQLYTWIAEGGDSKSSNTFTVLDERNTAVVYEAFSEIEKDKTLSLNDKVFAKASTAIFLTENYPEELSLGSLAYQLVDRMQGVTGKEDKAMVEYLKNMSGIGNN